MSHDLSIASTALIAKIFTPTNFRAFMPKLVGVQKLEKKIIHTIVLLITPWYKIDVITGPIIF